MPISIVVEVLKYKISKWNLFLLILKLLELFEKTQLLFATLFSKKIEKMFSNVKD
jgi:hypothetical protein